MSELQSTLPLWLLAFPLIGFLLNGLVVPALSGGIEKTKPEISGALASLAILCSFVLAIVAAASNFEGETLFWDGYEWISIGSLVINFSLRIDPLSSLLTLLITGIGFLIHLYSVGYMHHEKGSSRYFSYLNLFCFSMLLLVMGTNLPVLFFGWEGVGLCSYLLIGYWFTDEQKASAGKKAFIVNRIGDLGFLLGMFLTFKVFGTLDFQGLEALAGLDAMATNALGLSAMSSEASNLPTEYIPFICLFLFIGATGKSAQIPLFVWLPDAMAGPTPVSALIHAATMVTAGIYLIARLFFLFDAAPDILWIVAHIGALTALLAASIALVQNDIKKVLAYSTVSQLGYMFLAAGVGAYQTAVFHLMTHAFFKALLFLGAGSVIHACQEEQDMRKMGGLKESMPVTFWTMLVGVLAIAGIPFFSGFFSKDEILYSTLALPGGAAHLYLIGLLTAFLTALYMARLLTMTFLGKNRSPVEVRASLHESPMTMTIPLVVLSVFAAISGFLGIPHVVEGIGLHIPHALSEWLGPVVSQEKFPLTGIHLPLPEWLTIIVSVAIAVGGGYLGYRLFENSEAGEDKLKSALGPAHQLFQQKYYIDEIYQALIVNPLRRLGEIFWQVIDRVVIDGFVNFSARLVMQTGQFLRVTGFGDVQIFIWMMSFAVVALLSALLFGYLL
jgi:NADH-quinone oxidoreductase subunit L